jgi:hypothetical protein
MRRASILRLRPLAGRLRAKSNSARLKRGDSPPWPRRGGRDIKKNAAKPPLKERTGWLVQATDYRSLNNHPVCAS